MSKSATRLEILYGTDEPPAASRWLTAGPLAAEFSDGNLRAISWHGQEALRAVSYLVRDENWGTCAPQFADLKVEEQPDRFAVSYRASCKAADGATLTYEARIEGDAGGRLVFDVAALPDRDFGTNRCGFCILHPIVGVAGEPVEVEHVDGSVEEARFPETIDPAQPFFDMRAITHTVTPGVTATCRMEGDAFEMEDQRNWTDASYKTYVRPLALPWPYELRAGEAQRQAITLTLSGTPAAPRSAADRPIVITIGDETGAAPDFGLVVTPEETAATLAAIEALAEVGPRHLILHYNPAEGHSAAALAGFAKLLRRLPLPATLECVLPCRDRPEAELRETARLVAEADLSLSALAVSPAPDLKSTPPGSTWPDCPPLDEIYRAARKAFPGVPLGGGMFNYFTELNRKRPPAELLDFVTHTTAPLVHAADDRSVMETLEALPFVTRSVRAIFGDKPYRIGPSAIGMRHNPYGARLADNPGAARRMTMVADEPRQKGLFAAAWMIGYAAATAPAGLTHLTLGALTGPFGVVDAGGRRPAFHAARALAWLSGLTMRVAESSDPAKVLALAAGRTVLVANLTADAVSVEVPGAARAEVLDEESFAAAAEGRALPERPLDGTRLRLGAYGFAAVATESPRP
jgi:hypothetical protein